MIYKLAADFVVLLHLGWIAFLIFGAIPGRLVPWIKWTHLGGLGFSVALQIFGWYCPLTHLEVWLRARHRPDTAYTGSFIARYAEEIVYPEVPEFVLLAGTIGVAAFSIWWYRRR